MVTCLKDSFVYSEKRVRDFVFAAIVNVLRYADHPRMLSRLTREVANEARHLAEQASFEFSNWETATKATINAMLGAGVLLTHGDSAVRHNIAAQATDIVSLREDFGDRTEAYLLEVLIRKLGDVTMRDHKALAHALFRQFDTRVPMEELEDRVVLLLAMLADRVSLLENGTYASYARAASLTPGSA